MTIYFNLQLFADDTQTTLLSGLTPEMKTFYDKVLIKEATPHLVHDQFGQTRDIPKGNGKTIEFRKFAALPKALTPLTEGVTPTGRNLEVTAIEATVEQYGDYVKISDMLDLTAIDPVLAETTQLLGQQAGITKDTITRDILNSGTNVFYAPNGTTAVTSRSALTANCKLTVDVVNRVVAHLRAVNAPTFEDGYYVAIIHPLAVYDLISSEGWLEAHKYTDGESIYKGEIGRIGGVRFVQSSEAKIWKGEGCPSGLAVFSTLFLARNAYGTTKVDGGGLQTIVKPFGSGDDALNQRMTAGWKMIHTAEILIQPYMIRVESCGAYSAEAEAN